VANTRVANAPDAAGTTYRYRDADRRRTYMRELMRKRRALIPHAQTAGGGAGFVNAVLFL
jgi:hypothetical protein